MTALHEHSLKGLIGLLFDEVSRLIRLELRMAQAEISEKLAHAETGLIMVAVGFLFGVCALLILLQTLVISLATAMPAWLASILVALATALIAVVLVRRGRRALSLRGLIPENTLRSLRRHEDTVSEKAS